MGIFQQGQINISALTVAGVYVQIIPPLVQINGVPTNVAGIVGSAAWGPVNAPTVVSGYSNFAAQFGNMVPRKFDAGTHVWNAYQQGQQVVFQMVRITDGTDTAATISIQSAALTLTSKYTGSFGNGQQGTIGPGAAANSIRATLLTPGVLPEVFDSILQGIQTLTPTAGTTYTSVPALTIPAPTTGIQAIANASLITYGTPTVGAGGATYAIGDTITLSNGVIVKVATLAGSAVATFVAQGTAGTALGSITGAGTATPTNPVAQVSTSGSGTGATVNLTWCVGPATIVNPGAGYTSAPVPVLTGGGSGVGGSYAAAIAYWVNIAAAINNGQGGSRGPSLNFVATNGTQTTAPTSPAVTYTLAGGTDGAAVTALGLIGIDVLPRTGMYALRGLGCSIAALADCDTVTTFTNQVSFGLFEGVYMIGVTPSGDTISNALTELSTAGIDSYAMKVMFGDWCLINDTVNNLQRLTSPQGFILGLLGNLTPNQSSLNKQIYGIVGTQKSQTGVAYTSGDLGSLVNARMDVIANPSAGGAYFGCQNGHNSSSSAAIHGDNYTRMTNFLASTLAAGMGIYVGTLINPGQMRRAKGTIDSFLQRVQDAKLIGDPDNPAAPPPWRTTLDTSINSPAQLAQGVEQALLQVQYQGILEELVISIQGGQNVTISRTTTPNPGGP